MYRYSSLLLIIVLLTAATLCACGAGSGPVPDTIYHNGKIVTVDNNFSLAEAVAIKGDRFLAVGSNREVLALAGANTRKIDLKGRTVIPGMIEAHAHPVGAATSELEEEIPDVHTVQELLDWVEAQVKLKGPGEWIVHPKMFATRLRELRPPSLAKLDRIAPKNPVFFNGSYGGTINSAAMRASGITSRTRNPGVLKDPKTGRPNGHIRGAAFRLLKRPRDKALSWPEHLDALEAMIHRYNAVGFTSVTDAAEPPSGLRQWQDLKRLNRLTARVYVNIRTDVSGNEEQIVEKLSNLGIYSGFGDEMVRVGPLKISIDGGILTGTAYMREPWGTTAKEIYGFQDPTYRGVRNYTLEELIPIVSAADLIGWKFTTHSTGGGGVDILLEAFDRVAKQNGPRDRRFSIIHGNFYTPESIKKAARLGVIADAQPAWFYKDADAMLQILGKERVRWFHPYKSMIDAGMMINAGSDHMVKFDSITSINPYNPFLSMWVAVTRKTERGTVIVPEEAISRQDAIRMYTINNAYGSFEEKLKGSIEPGKLADMVVLSDDILTCPEDDIRNIKAQITILGGLIVYQDS
ncbi:amidohydrolase [candidate division KSB1 bacterium]